MPRFYVPDPSIQNGLLRIDGDEVKHIRKVLRLKAGDQIILFDGLGKEYEGTIVEEKSSSVLVKVQNIFFPQKDSPLEVTLAQSLLKGEKMDFLIQKATELGVKEIIPFVSSRSVPLLERSKRQQRHRRWERIAVEASKQCGRGVVPKIESLKDYFEMLQVASQDGLRLILWEKEGIKLKEVLEKSEGKAKVFFIVGPEGGFSEEEIGEAQKSGFIPVTLGRRILRAETASLCLLSILQYQRGDMGEKKGRFLNGTGPTRKEGYEEVTTPPFSPDCRQTPYKSCIPESTCTFSGKLQHEFLDFPSFYRRSDNSSFNPPFHLLAASLNGHNFSIFRTWCILEHNI